MDIVDNLNAVKTGALSRRAFNRSLLGMGVGLMTAPLLPGRAAAATGAGTFFT